MKLKKEFVGMGLAISMLLSGLYIAPEKIRAEIGKEAVQKVKSTQVVALKQKKASIGYFKPVKIADDKEGTYIYAKIRKDFKKIILFGNNDSKDALECYFDLIIGDNGAFLDEDPIGITMYAKDFNIKRNLKWDTHKVDPRFGNTLNYLLSSERDLKKPKYAIRYRIIWCYVYPNSEDYFILKNNEWVKGHGVTFRSNDEAYVNFLSKKEFDKISTRKIRLKSGDKIKLVLKEDIIYDRSEKYKSGLTISKDSWWDSRKNKTQKLAWKPVDTITERTTFPFEIDEKRHPKHMKKNEKTGVVGLDYAELMSWYSAKKNRNTFVKEITDDTKSFSMKVKYKFTDRKKRGLSGYSAVLYKNGKRLADVWLDDYFTRDELEGKKDSKQKIWDILKYNAKDNTITFKAFDVAKELN
jgi:hypothetical protein